MDSSKNSRLAEQVRRFRARFAQSVGTALVDVLPRLYLPDIRAQQVGRRQGAERAAINAPMQGTAADLIKKAMIATHRGLAGSKLQSRLILQVHDELVLEVPEAELEEIRDTLPRLMGEVAELSVPLLVEVGAGANWDEAH